MPNLDTALPPRIRRRLHRWLDLWDTPSLAATLRVEFSPRLRRAFGRCYQEQRLIRLAASLGDSQSFLLDEILCHEAAHAAVYELHGATVRAHGEEWEELMRAAGFEPRIRIPVAVRCPARASTRRRVFYLHRCPSCDRSRRATRPMQQWRCRTCVDAGASGRLEIERRVTGHATARAAGKSERAIHHRLAAGNGKKAGPRRRAAGGSTSA